MAGGIFNVMLPKLFHSMKNYANEITTENRHVVGQNQNFFDLVVQICIGRTVHPISKQSFRSLSFCFETELLHFLNESFVAFDGENNLFFRFERFTSKRIKYRIDTSKTEEQITHAFSQNIGLFEYSTCILCIQNFNFETEFKMKFFNYNFMKFERLQELKKIKKRFINIY